MSKVNEIFSKKSGITVSDIDNLIESNVLHENDEIELTDIDNFITGEIKVSKKKKRKYQTIKIVSELVSFLNSNSGTGLLFLGLAEKNDEIIKKGVSTLKNKEQIRSIIYNNIGTIPHNTEKFKLDVIPVKYNEVNIFIINIENNDLDCIFYSKIDNNVYIRQGDESKSLNLPEFLELTAKKNHARIFTKFEGKKAENDSYAFNIIFVNEGLEPGMYIANQIFVSTIDEIDFSIKGRNIRTDDESLIEIKDNKIVENGEIVGESDELIVQSGDNSIVKKCQKCCKYNFSCMLGYPPNSILVYPGLRVIMGTMTIEKGDFEMFIDIKNFEKRGSSQQEFYISSKDDQIEILELNREFKSYLKF